MNANLPTKNELLAVARFAEIFDACVTGRWHADPGKAPWFELAPEVSAFVRAAYASGVVISFDWQAFQAEGERIASSETLLASVELDVVRRLVTMAIRRDRFCEGALAGWIGGGQAARVLRRLAVIADAM